MHEWLATYGMLILAAVSAGAINALAGGGTLLTFPSLHAVLPAVFANGTSTVALMPGSLASVWGFRRELRSVKHWARILAAPSLIGGLVGVKLVTQLDATYFERLVPWLILMATLLFVMQPLAARLTDMAHRAWPIGVVLLVQLAVAVYGGYFGAGIGIIMLAVFSYYGMHDIHEMNAVKTVQAVLINVVAAIEFIRTGFVDWHFAGVMAVGAMIGGYLGAHFGRRLNRTLVRWIVVGIGLGLSVYYFSR